VLAPAGDLPGPQGGQADRSLADPVIEEALQRDSPAQFMARQCLSAGVRLGGMAVSGEWVLLSIGSANRDVNVFNNPDSFVPDRPNLKEHLACGTGPHICPGSALDRLELRLAVATWCESVAAFGLAPGYSWQPLGTGMLHGPKRLDLVVTAS
jgi:cytochrome P450